MERLYILFWRCLLDSVELAFLRAINFFCTVLLEKQTY